jgi:anaerobic magnesium-protoporphyrin IX monomethyl ester cyclase
MRFLLVNPFYPISETPSPPLGLAFLGAALEQAGIETQVLDLVVYPYSREMLQDLLAEFKPDIVGSTCVTMSFDEAIKVLRDIKDIDPSIATAMGGPHVTFRAEETLAENPFVDYIMQGEGEEAIVELTRAVETGQGFDDIVGLAYRKDGQIVSNGIRPPGIDVNSLPIPARHLLPLGRYRTLGMAISMTSSRGCPFNCIFCVGRKMVGAKVRYRDPIKVVDELGYLAGLGFTQINMADDLFTANKKHCFAVCDEIMRRGIKTKWTSFARVDTVSLDVLKAMKDAGCSAVSFGVESGNQEILKTIKKGITLDQVIKAVEMCNEAGMIPHASFILGLPGETPRTIQESVAFGDKIKEMGVSHGFHLLAPFPGTEVRDRADEYGLEILTNDWREYHANRAIVRTPEATPEMLNQVVLEWEEEFDKYLGFIKERREKGLTDEEESWPLDNLERIVLIYELMMNRIIEEHGRWPVWEQPSDDDGPVQSLVGRVAALTEEPENLVDHTLRYAIEHGHLRYDTMDDHTVFSWVDYLP